MKKYCCKFVPTTVASFQIMLAFFGFFSSIIFYMVAVLVLVLENAGKLSEVR